MIASFKFLLSTLLLGAVLHGASADTVVTAPGAGAQWMANDDCEVRWIGAEEDTVDVNLVRGLPEDRAVVRTLCKSVKGSAGVCTAHVPAELAAGIDYAVAVGKSSYSGYFSVNMKDATTDCANSDDETCRNGRRVLLLQKRAWANARGKRMRYGGITSMHRNGMFDDSDDNTINQIAGDADNAVGDTEGVVDNTTGTAPAPSANAQVSGGISGPSIVGKKSSKTA